MRYAAKDYLKNGFTSSFQGLIFCINSSIFLIGDNLVIIGGLTLNRRTNRNDNTLSDVELISPSSDNDECDPTDLNEEVAYHASVLSPDGKIITCGGNDKNWNDLSKCQIQTSTGETRSFPSMTDKRAWFEMAIIHGTLYAIGGWSSYNKMESINIMTENQWKDEPDMPFRVTGHCVVTISTKMVVIGGWGGGVSKLWFY